MLQLHFYSNHAGRLVLGGGSNDWWLTDTYPLDSIKEFEQISEAWKRCLAELLRKGYYWSCLKPFLILTTNIRDFFFMNAAIQNVFAELLCPLTACSISIKYSMLFKPITNRVMFPT